MTHPLDGLNGRRPPIPNAGTSVEILEQRLRDDPGGPNAEAVLQRLATLFTSRMRAANSKARPRIAAIEPAVTSLGSKEWITLLPRELGDDLLASLIAAQELLIAELANGETSSIAPADPGHVVEATAAAYARHGLAAALHVLLRDAPRSSRGNICEMLAERLSAFDRRAALQFLWLAYAASPSGAKARKISQRMFKLGDLGSSARLAKVADLEPMTPYLGELRLASAFHERPPAVPQRQQTARTAGKNVAYVASSALPYKTVGYTVRTHSLLTALRDEGVGVDCYVRPGYPWDRPAVLAAEPAPAGRRRFGNVDYFYSRVQSIVEDPERFVDRMADALVDRFRAAKPRLVHAASNHRTALPALIAARRLSLPFIYEVRGLWELTTATKIAWWEETERFALERSLELLVARNADHVMTITRGVADELVAGGVPAEHITLLPNGVDPERFVPMEPDQELRARIGLHPDDLVLVYCGSLTNYEGLDDLIEAVAALNPTIRARLIIVGDGPYLDALRAAAARTRFGSAVTFIGAVATDEVRRYWSLADVVALPRKPFKVCRVVSPLKPFEAMAMGKPVILSDLPASREIVRDGETGLICRPADPVSLADAIARLARDPALRTRLGAQAREWATTQHSWKTNAKRLIELYDRLAPPRSIPPRKRARVRESPS